jgi:hypothetical protein
LGLENPGLLVEMEPIVPSLLGAAAMSQSHHGRFRQQVHFLRQQFLQKGDLLLTDVLSAEVLAQAHETIGVAWKDRIFTPLVTLWVFLGPSDEFRAALHRPGTALARERRSTVPS